MRTWERAYSKYSSAYSYLLLLAIILTLADANWNAMLSFDVAGLWFIIWLGYLPFLLWDIKTGFLSSPLLIPSSLFGHRIMAVSRRHSPRLFWAVIVAQLVIYTLLGGMFAIALG